MRAERRKDYLCLDSSLVLKRLLLLILPNVRGWFSHTVVVVLVLWPIGLSCVVFNLRKGLGDWWPRVVRPRSCQMSLIVVTLDHMHRLIYNLSGWWCEYLCLELWPILWGSYIHRLSRPWLAPLLMLRRSLISGMIRYVLAFVAVVAHCCHSVLIDMAMAIVLTVRCWARLRLDEITLPLANWLLHTPYMICILHTLSTYLVLPLVIHLVDVLVMLLWRPWV